MRKKPRQSKNTLTIPFNVVTLILVGIIILLMSYIYSNYVVAAPVQHSHVAVQPEDGTKNQSLPPVIPLKHKADDK